DHRLVDAVTGCKPRWLWALAGALTVCGAGAVHATAAHASATHHRPALSPALAATRHTVGTGVSTVGSAPLRRSTAPVAVWASDAWRASTSAPQGAGQANSGGDTPTTGSLEADAYGVNLDPLATCLSCTSAQAGRNSSSAEGREFRL